MTRRGEWIVARWRVRAVQSSDGSLFLRDGSGDCVLLPPEAVAGLREFLVSGPAPVPVAEAPDDEDGESRP